MAANVPATVADCQAIFESVQSLTFADDAAKQARRHALIDSGAVTRVNAMLSACCASEDVEGQIAATAALSELSFLIRDVARLQAFVPVLPLLVRILSRSRSLELRVWAIFALCNCTSNAPPGSNMLEETWRSGAMDAALSWLALYLATKDVMHEAGAIDAHATVTDFMKVPAHELALRAVAEEDMLREDEPDAEADAEADAHADAAAARKAEEKGNKAKSPSAAAVSPADAAAAPAAASPASPTTRQPAAGERLSAAMSVSGHRIAMNALALCVIFSRSDAFMMRTRSRRLADCAPFQHYRRWLKRRAGRIAASSRGASPDRAVTGSPVARDCGAVSPSAVDWRSGVLHHPLFSPRATSLDLAIYAMESADPFYAHVAASVLAYQMGAEELSGSSDAGEPLPRRRSSGSGVGIARCGTGGAGILSTSASGSAAPVPALGDEDCDAILVSDSDDGAASSSGSDLDIDSCSGASGAGAGARSPSPAPGGAAAADARRLRRRVAKTRFTDAARRMQRGFPVEAVQMLLEAARAGLANRRYKGFVAYLRVWTYLQPLANIAVADVNKRTLLSLGAIEVAAQALAHPDDRSRQYASQLLWLLAFDAEAKAAIASSAAALDGLKALSKDKNTAVRMQALGALWQIQAVAPAALPSIVPAEDSVCGASHASAISTTAAGGHASAATLEPLGTARHGDGAAALSISGAGTAAVPSQSTSSVDHRHDDAHEIAAEAGAASSHETVPRLLPSSQTSLAQSQPAGDHIVSWRDRICDATGASKRLLLTLALNNRTK